MKSRDAELGQPSVDEFKVLHRTVLMLGEEPGATIRPHSGNGQYISLERHFVNLDSRGEWTSLSISFSGVLNMFRGGTKMTLQYRELAQSDAAVNQGLGHSYVITRKGNEVVEFGHSIFAFPMIKPAVTAESETSDELLDMAQEGERILKANLGSQLELSAGDCGVLFDRLMQLRT